MDEPTNQGCIEEADNEISSESESEEVTETDTESDSDSFLISNYEWVPESATEEEPEEEEFDLLRLMDRETVHESPPTTPNPNPESTPPTLPPPSTTFDVIDFLMAGPKEEVQLKHCPTCTCFKH